MKCVDLQSSAGTRLQTDDVIHDRSAKRRRRRRRRTRRPSAIVTGWAQSQREEKGRRSHQQSERVCRMWAETFFKRVVNVCCVHQFSHTLSLWHTDARGLQFKQPLGPKQNSRLVIFDENKAETEPQEPKFEIWTAPPTARAKENEQKPEKWSNVKVRGGCFWAVC